MKESNELFELCKQVYEATGLADTIDYFYLKNNGDYSVLRANHTQVDHNWWKLGGEVPARCFPLYTSDYLLEKLPVYSEDAEGMLSVTTRQGQERNGWMAYYEDVDGYSVGAEGIGKSPLEALLRLTLKLHEEEV